MQFIADSFAWLIDIFRNIWEFITGLIDSLLLLFDYVGMVANMCYSIIDGMPSWLKVFGTITIVVSVLYLIVGRQTGGEK